MNRYEIFLPKRLRHQKSGNYCTKCKKLIIYCNCGTVKQLPFKEREMILIDQVLLGKSFYFKKDGKVYRADPRYVLTIRRR